MSEPLLEVHDLEVYFPIKKGVFKKKADNVKAVNGVNLSVNKGETLGIVGESGCRKSTLARAILGLEKPTSGDIHFEGESILNYNAKQMQRLRRDIQMVFQDPFTSLNPRMKVSEIIAAPLKAFKFTKNIDQRVKELMELVGLKPEYHNRLPHEFSGGQRQRIGIARALALQPKLIVCDEPVSALDVSVQAQILNLLEKLQREFNLTYIFIAHGLPAVKHISDRIAVMYLGRIVEIADKDDLFDRTMHPYTEGLLSAVPIPDPTLRDDKERIILEGDMPSPVNPPSG